MAGVKIEAYGSSITNVVPVSMFSVATAKRPCSKVRRIVSCDDAFGNFSFLGFGISGSGSGIKLKSEVGLKV